MPSAQFQAPGVTTVQPTAVPLTFAPAPAGQFICRTGVVQRRPAIGIPFRGTHLLISPQGAVIATLVPTGTVNLPALEGRLTTVCGISEGEIEGVLSIRATSATPVGAFFPQLPFGFDQNILIQLLLTNPALLRLVLQNPSLFQLLLQNPALLQQLILLTQLQPGVFGGFPGVSGGFPGAFGLQPGAFGAFPGGLGTVFS